jgi:uncharacterized protein YndB with AHSA1/START domain
MADINLLLNIKAPRERVYDIISTPAGARMWWTVDVAKKNDELVMGFDHGAIHFRLKPTQAQPPAYLEWECVGDHPEWTGTRLTWELREASPTETVLRFTHSNWKAVTDYMAQCGWLWVKVLDRLKAAARSGDPYPFFTD